jgi:YesN/AraC family two-component response regulator
MVMKKTQITLTTLPLHQTKKVLCRQILENSSLRATIAMGQQKLPQPRWEMTKMITLETFQFPDRPQLQKIFDFIESHYDKAISLKEIAITFERSPSYLTQLMRRLTGKTLYQWLVDRRMFQARYLLLNTDLAIYQVAKAVGYDDAGHFIKHFRKLHGLPPQTWREKAIKF